MDRRYLLLGDPWFIQSPGLATDQATGASASVPTVDAGGNPLIPGTPYSAADLGITSSSVASPSSSSSSGLSPQVTQGLFNIGSSLLTAGGQVASAAVPRLLTSPTARGNVVVAAAPSTNYTPYLLLAAAVLGGVLLLRRKG